MNGAIIRTSVLAALRAIPDLVVFDGFVPNQVPTDAHGYVRPYVALYTGAGIGQADQGLCGLADTDTTTRQLQTTLVAATMGQLEPVTNAVTLALTNLPCGTGRLHPVREQHLSTVPQPDPSVSPARMFLPLQWQATTH